jgi:RNA polymerase sigma-70 factor, ECF subfamily
MATAEMQDPDLRRSMPAAAPVAPSTPKGQPQDEIRRFFVQMLLIPQIVRNPSTTTLPVADTGLPQADLVAAIPRLRRYARVLAGNPVRADDLVQDTLLRAWDKRRLWQVGSDLRAWLFKIMHNIFINQRALARRDRQTVSIDAEEDGDVVWQIPVRPTQQTRVELIEMMHQVERLPADQREVLLLAAVEELRYEEIAAVLGIPIGTVMSRLSRAREKLRRMSEEPPSGLKSGEKS